MLRMVADNYQNFTIDYDGMTNALLSLLAALVINWERIARKHRWECQQAIKYQKFLVFMDGCIGKIIIFV